MLRRIAHPDIAKAAANIVWLGLERLTQIVVAIAIAGLLARYFGPEVFGKWQYANTLLLVLAPITWVCGAEILVPTIVRRGESDLGAVLGSAFVLRLTVSALALAATWAGVAAGLTDPIVGAMLAALAVTMLFREPFIGVVNSWLQSLTYSKPQLVTSMMTALGKLALVYLFVHMAVTAPRFAWLWALEAAVIGVVLLIYYARRHGGRLGWRVEPADRTHSVSATARTHLVSSDHRLHTRAVVRSVDAPANENASSSGLRLMFGRIAPSARRCRRDGQAYRKRRTV